MTDLGNIQVTINDIPLSEGVFDGKFFGGRSVRLDAAPGDDKQVTGWDITTVSTNGSVTQTHIDGAAYTFTMPTSGNVTIKAVIGVTAIRAVKRENGNETQYYSIDGKRLSQPQRGINIVRMSDGTTKKVTVRNER